MSKPPNQDTEVDEILTRFAAKYEATKTIATTENYLKTTKTALNLYYKSILLEVIEPYYKASFNAPQPNAQYQLLVKLRQRLESRLG